MVMFLNRNRSYEDFSERAGDPYFVDKSPLIQELIPALGRKNRYFCITRPRWIGKNLISVQRARLGIFWQRFFKRRARSLFL